MIVRFACPSRALAECVCRTTPSVDSADPSSAPAAVSLVFIGGAAVSSSAEERAICYRKSLVVKRRRSHKDSDCFRALGSNHVAGSPYGN